MKPEVGKYYLDEKNKRLVYVNEIKKDGRFPVKSTHYYFDGTIEKSSWKLDVRNTILKEISKKNALKYLI